MPESHRRLRMFAGPNGSGKTSLVHRLAKEHAARGLFSLHHFINADVFLEQMQTEEPFDLGKYGVYVSTDQFISAMRASGRLARNHPFFDAARIEDFRLTAPAAACDSHVAAAIADLLREHLLASSQSFSFETVMSHPNKVEFFARTKANGYRTYLYFVATNSPLLNIHRVGNRANRGGHDVSDEKITTRYHRALTLLPGALAAAHRAYLFDNSGVEPVWLAERMPDGALEVKVSASELPDWFTTHVSRN